MLPTERGTAIGTAPCACPSGSVGTPGGTEHWSLVHRGETHPLSQPTVKELKPRSKAASSVGVRFILTRRGGEESQHERGSCPSPKRPNGMPPDCCSCHSPLNRWHCHPEERRISADGFQTQQAMKWT